MAIIKVLYPSGGTPITPPVAAPTGWLSDAIPIRIPTTALVVAALTFGGVPPPYPVLPPTAALNFFLYYGPDLFAKPYPAAAQQWSSFQPRGAINSITPQGFYPQPPDRFAKPFPVSAQQYAAIPWQGNVPTAVTPHGWEGAQLEYRFAKPVPVSVQQYDAHPPQGSIPTPATPQGWGGQQLSYKYAKPYPVSAQQYAAVIPRSAIPLPFFILWQGWELSYRFAKPFPVTEQIFSVWDLVGDVPPFRPPGAGKRRDFPSYIPQPAYDAKPNKPFRPIWDKPREGVIEQHPQPVPPAQIPPPPPELFSAAPAPSPVDVHKLPNFNEFMPPDPMGLAQRMRDAQDMSDAMAVLKAMGLIPDNE